VANFLSFTTKTIQPTNPSSFYKAYVTWPNNFILYVGLTASVKPYSYWTLGNRICHSGLTFIIRKTSKEKIQLVISNLKNFGLPVLSLIYLT